DAIKPSIGCTLNAGAGIRCIIVSQTSTDQNYPSDRFDKVDPYTTQHRAHRKESTAPSLGCSEFCAIRTLLCRVRFDLIETVTRILLIRGILAHYATPSTRCTVEREANRRCTSIGS